MTKAEVALCYLEDLSNVKEFYQSEIGTIRDEIKKLQKENSLLRECVAYYADPEWWWCGNGMSEGELVGFNDSIDCGDCRDVNGRKEVGGARARKCLAKLEER